MTLTDKFPTRARVNGKVYELNTDFRVGLKIMQAFEDKQLLDFEKQIVMVALLFKEIPSAFEAAVKAAIKFLDCGHEPSGHIGGRVYSFTRDADYIYSAFLQTYGVNLQTAEMHWWQFCAMFGDLSPDTTFESMRTLRDRHNRGKLTKDEREVWFRMRDMLDLEIEPADAETRAARENFDRLLRG